MADSAAPVCDNCKRIVAPMVYTVTLLVDGVLTGQRKLCRACLTHAADELTKPAPWLGVTPTRAGRG